MSAIHLLRSHRRSIAALLLVLWVPACSSWQVPGVAPATYIEQQHPAQVRVSTDTSRVQLDHPWMRADTIVGTRWIATHAGLTRVDTVQVAVSQVSRMEVRKGATGNTLILVGGILLALAIAGGIALSNALTFH